MTQHFLYIGVASYALGQNRSAESLARVYAAQRLTVDAQTTMQEMQALSIEGKPVRQVKRKWERQMQRLRTEREALISEGILIA